METAPPPHPSIGLATHLYYQLVYTLAALLPPPLDDSPEALNTRNHAAIAKVAALLPVNANEADLAAQCIAARVQAEDLLRLLRHHADDIGLVMRLNAQYASMVRTSLSVHARLMKMQALRQMREAIDAAANDDARALHVAERSMLGIVNPNAGPLQPAWPEQTRPALQAGAPATRVDQDIDEHVSESRTKYQDAAFETWVRQQLLNQRPTGSDETDPPELTRQATAHSGPPDPQFPANGHESSTVPGYVCHID